MKKNFLRLLFAMCALMLSFSSCEKDGLENDGTGGDNSTIYPVKSLIITVDGTDYTLSPKVVDGEISKEFAQKTPTQNVITLKQLSLESGVTATVSSGDTLEFESIESDNPLFIKCQYELVLSNNGKNETYTITLTSDAPTDEAPYFHVVSTNNMHIDQGVVPQIVSVEDNGIYEGFVTFVSDWDNVGLVTKNLDYVLDNASVGLDAAVSYGSFTLSDERAYISGAVEGENKPQGGWGNWAYNNSSMHWYVTYDSSSKDFTLLSAVMGISGSAVGSTTAMTYDSETKTWSVVAALSAGSLNIVSIPVTDGDPELSFGDAGEGALSSEGSAISIATADTYKITVDLSDPRNYTYNIAVTDEVVGGDESDDDTADTSAYYYVISSSNIDMNEVPQITSVNGDGIHEGFVTFKTDWDNVALVTENKDLIFDLPGGLAESQSYATFTLSSKREYIADATDGENKPSSGWGNWAYNNSDMHWYVTYDPSSKELTLLSAVMGISGSAVDSTTAMTYDSASATWSVTTALSAGSLNIVSIPVTEGDPVLSFGNAGDEKLSSDGSAIEIATAGTYTITANLSNPSDYNYSIK